MKNSKPAPDPANKIQFVERGAPGEMPPSATAYHQSSPSGTERFFIADIDRVGTWLVKRIRERYAFMDERQILTWLRSVMSSNEWLFIKTQHAVGLANMQRMPMRMVPFVQEVFVLIMDANEESQIEEGLNIYRHFRKWADSMSASELRVDIFSDVPLKYQKKEFGQLYLREIAVAKLV